MSENLNFIQKLTYEYAESLAKEFYLLKLQGNKIYCPALRKHVYFTHSGWNHFVEKDRSINELITRFFALSRVVEVLRKCQKYTNYNFRKKKELIIEYWSFEAEIELVQIKVVVTKVGGGRPYFLSCVWLGEIKP